LAIINRGMVGNGTGVGIDAGNVSMVTDCVVQNTRGNGIQGVAGSTIRRNTLSNIGVDTNPAAIFVSGSGNVIEANTATFSPAYGLRVSSGGDLILHNNMRNTAGGYSQVADGNDMGPLQSPPNATSAWANFGL